MGVSRLLSNMGAQTEHLSRLGSRSKPHLGFSEGDKNFGLAWMSGFEVEEVAC
jgi:hypothetical protein